MPRSVGGRHGWRRRNSRERKRWEGGGSGGRMETGLWVQGSRRTGAPTVATRVSAWVTVESETEASVAKAAQAAARVSMEGRYTWLDEGARGHADRTEDGRGGGESAGAAGRGTVAGMVHQRRRDGGAGSAGQGVEEEGSWLSARSAHAAHLLTTNCSLLTVRNLYVYPWPPSRLAVLSYTCAHAYRAYCSAG